MSPLHLRMHLSTRRNARSGVQGLAGFSGWNLGAQADSVSSSLLLPMQMPSPSNDASVLESDASSVLEVDPVLTVTPEPALKPTAAAVLLSEGLLKGVLKGHNGIAKVHSEAQCTKEERGRHDTLLETLSAQHLTRRPRAKPRRKVVRKAHSELCSSSDRDCSETVCSEAQSSVYSSDASECKSEAQVGQRPKKTRARRPRAAQPSSRCETSRSGATCEPSSGAAQQSSRGAAGHGADPAEESQSRTEESRSMLVSVPEHSPASSSEFLCSSGRLLSPATASSGSVAQAQQQDIPRRPDLGDRQKRMQPASTGLQILQNFFRVRLCGMHVGGSRTPGRHAAPRSRHRSHSTKAASRKRAPVKPGRYRPVPGAQL